MSPDLNNSYEGKCEAVGGIYIRSGGLNKCFDKKALIKVEQ